MNHGPLPTRLVFLSDLSTTAYGTKVRFLGCVTHYDQATGLLTVRHAYPPPPSPCSTAVVDVNLLLESLKSADTRVGEWLNLMGYVKGHSQVLEKNKTHGRAFRRGMSADARSGVASVARVEAMMLWSAGGIKLAEYERALAARLEAQKKDG